MTTLLPSVAVLEMTYRCNHAFSGSPTAPDPVFEMDKKV